jgi:hypothetical protein
LINHQLMYTSLDCFATLAMTVIGFAEINKLRGAKRRSNLFTSAKPIQEAIVKKMIFYFFVYFTVAVYYIYVENYLYKKQSTKKRTYNDHANVY